MIDGLSCYKKGLQPIAKHLKGKESLSDYQNKESKKIDNKVIDEVRGAILRM